MIISNKVRLSFISKRTFFVCFLYFFCFSSFILEAQADTNREQAIAKALEMELFKDKFWLGILHYQFGKSKIVDKSFFISNRGRTDPKAELIATLNLYFDGLETPSKKDDLNPISRFPARLSWLNDKLNLTDFKIDKDSCPSIYEWIDLDKVEDVSLVFVSGYLGNPASSFGHALLRIKLAGEVSDLRLFDEAINYGASVNGNDNMLVYALKGLFGGYYANFSDKYFYSHDQVYTNKESRDMWEYDLNFDKNKRNMLLFHIYELLNINFRYYFLSANCAQRIAILLDIFIQENIYPVYYPVYIPEELFYRIDLADSLRVKQSGPRLIKDIHYIPSAHRKLYYEVDRMQDRQKEVFTKVVVDGEDIADAISYLVKVQDRIDVLNVLLTYQYYKLIKEGGDDAALEYKQIKDKILRERFKLPGAIHEDVVIPELEAPIDIPPPSSLNIGFRFENDREAYLALGLSMFRRELVGQSSLLWNEMRALDFQLGITDQDVFLDSFDFLKIKNNKFKTIKETGEFPFAWNLNAGIKRVQVKSSHSYDTFIESGFGFSAELYNMNSMLYTYINGSAHTVGDNFRVSPVLGIVMGRHRSKLNLEYQKEIFLDSFTELDVVNVVYQYQINRKKALRLKYKKSNAETLALDVVVFW